MSNIRKNIIYQTIYRVITILSPIITSPIIARALGAQKLGLFSATLAYVNYFQLLSILGVENYGNRSIAASQGNRKEQQTLFWNIYAAQVLSCFFAIALYFLSFIFLPKERIPIYIFQGVWLIGSLSNINWYFFGTEQFKLTVTRSIIVKIFTVVSIVLFIHSTDDLLIYVLIMAGDTVLSNLSVWPFLKKSISFEMPNWVKVKTHIKPMIILFIPILAISVFHIMDKSMLDWLGTEIDSGFYYSADKVINLPLSIITAIGTVMLPRISNEYSKGNTKLVKSILYKSTELTIFLSCAIGVGIAAIANEFIPLFFGKGFETCISLVYWFIPVLFAKAIGDLIRTQYMIPSHMDKKYTISVAMGALVNLLSNYIFIIRFGALGAVIGTLIAEWTVTILQLWFTRKHIRFISYVLTNCIYIIPAIFMIFAVRISATIISVPIIIKVIIGIVLGGVVYILFCIPIWTIKKDSIFHKISLHDFINWK